MVGAVQLGVALCAGGGIRCLAVAVISIRHTPLILPSNTRKRCSGAMVMITSAAGHAYLQAIHRRKLVYLLADSRSPRKRHLSWKAMLWMYLLIFPHYPGSRMTPLTLPLNHRIFRNSPDRCSAAWMVLWRATKGISLTWLACLKINMPHPLAQGTTT